MFQNGRGNRTTNQRSNRTMKNIHILPTDKPSRLHFNEFEELVFTPKYKKLDGVNIYITSDEEEPYPYALHIKKQEVLKINGIGENSKELFHDKGFNYQYECKKIILTTDIDLIKDGVKAINDEFLEWFVKNPNSKEVISWRLGNYSSKYIGYIEEKYTEGLEMGQIIPKEERTYTEEDVKNAFLDGWQLRDGDLPFPKAKKKWFNEFKKE